MGKDFKGSDILIVTWGDKNKNLKKGDIVICLEDTNADEFDVYCLRRERDGVRIKSSRLKHYKYNRGW